MDRAGSTKHRFLRFSKQSTDRKLPPEIGPQQFSQCAKYTPESQIGQNHLPKTPYDRDTVGYGEAGDRLASRDMGGIGMARAIAVHHGSFGRATLYELDNPLITHAHREGHLIFYLGGGKGRFTVGDTDLDLDENNAVAVSPWEPHSFTPVSEDTYSYVLTLYIKPMWFLENSQSAEFALNFGRPRIHMTPEVEQWVGRLSSLLLNDQPSNRFDGFLYETCSQCFEQSWEGVHTRPLLHSVRLKFNDFRVRRSLRVMQECYNQETSIDQLARNVGLSRPHFFKLFKMQMGITPNLYLNTLRAEHAIDDLISTSKSVTEIGLDLGFASQAGFTRFFTSNVGIPPTDYRRVAHFV